MSRLPKFKTEMSFDKRLETSGKLLNNYPDRVPVIVSQHSKTDPTLYKNKFLVPFDIPGKKFLYEVRKHIRIGPEQAIFLYYDNRLLEPNALLGTIYKRYKDPDGFLYITYTTENTFGSTV